MKHHLERLGRKDAVIVFLIAVIYIPLLIYPFVSREHRLIEYAAEGYVFARIFFVLYPLAGVVLWLWMLFDWGNRQFLKRKHKIYWFIVFFSLYVFGSTAYYLIVCVMGKGVAPEKEKTL
jgi:hypothetical protein